MTSFKDHLGWVAADVETTLDQLLTPPSDMVEGKAVLWDAMRYATLGGGKQLRAFLAVESAGMFDVDRTGALRAGASVECLHAYSLVHDDLPAMDDDDLGRGKPTTHKALTRQLLFWPVSSTMSPCRSR